MLGASFSFSALATGTLVSGEFSRHFDFPYQLSTDAVLGAVLSPVEFDPGIGSTGFGEFGPDAVIHGYRRADRSQAALAVTQLLGPRARATQVFIDLNVPAVFFETHAKLGSQESDFFFSAGHTNAHAGIAAQNEDFPAAGEHGFDFIKWFSFRYDHFNTSYK